MADLKVQKGSFEVQYPSQSGETRRLIRLADWNRLNRKLNELPSGNWYTLLKEVAFALFGISIPAALSLLVIDKDKQLIYAIYTCSAVASFILAVIFLFVHMRLNKDKTEAIKEIRTDMDEIESTFNENK